jgi:hypothetical protein
MVLKPSSKENFATPVVFSYVGKYSPTPGGNVYKSMRIVLLSVGLVMAGCSTSSSNSGSINGSWNASLTSSPGGSVIYAFSTTFTETNANGLSVSNFTFTTNGPCFQGDQTSETGNFTLSGNFNGNVTGTFGMTISTEFPGGVTQNVLTLSNGTINGNTISGSWTLTGVTGCNGQGTFTINKA